MMFSFKQLKRFSVTLSRDWLYRYSFAAAGLRSVSTKIGGETIMNCWIPKINKPSKPNLLLIHGFGANAMWQYGEHLRLLTTRFNVYIPDLLFFGSSFTLRRERTERFQARCVMKLMEVHEVRRMSVVGISYGGFVGYSIAAEFPEAVEKVVFCCTGVCLEERDMEEGLFRVSGLEEAANILVPQSPDKLRELIGYTFVKPLNVLPTWILTDFIDVMYKDFVKEKRELLQAILKGRQLSNLPKIEQRALIIWGEQDQIFPVELAHRLKRYVGEGSELVIIKNAGHAVNVEKAKEFEKHLLSFLVDQPLPSPFSSFISSKVHHFSDCIY